MILIMTSPIESGGLHTVNPSNERLSPADVEQNAFGMIGEFKDALRELPAFRAQVTNLDLYFGESSDGQPVVRSGNDTWVHFSIENMPYRVVYECSGDRQRLDFVRGVMEGNPGIVSDKNHIILQSRRLANQGPNSLARITYVGTHYAENRTPRIPQEYITNRPLALQKAQGMLVGLSPQK